MLTNETTLKDTVGLTEAKRTKVEQNQTTGLVSWKLQLHSNAFIDETDRKKPDRKICTVCPYCSNLMPYFVLITEGN
jgi:hypothetical protein